MKNFFCFLFVSLLLFTGSTMTIAESPWDQKDVAIDKKWTIKFNMEVLNETVNKENIYIEDSNGNRLSNVIVSIGNSEDTVVVENFFNYEYEKNII
ncbi:hypothetical protein BGM26_02930 [Bacillus sp. FJAT-29790]|uniref:hypothetical protein n=1 Tax=Bacillus sp. FJAT-29790 TaxID=1895002 RepID=UPI001C231428|nr:hypothetical protein [Bacillus sp. FJAT-29790]MBU8877947.1 hypothetical protein [Bacillus sp. FJAT-29790]